MRGTMATPFSSPRIFDALYGREFQLHSQSNAVAREHLYHLLAMGDLTMCATKVSATECGNIDIAPLGQLMAGPNHQGKRVPIELHGGQFPFLGKYEITPISSWWLSSSRGIMRENTR